MIGYNFYSNKSVLLLLIINFSMALSVLFMRNQAIHARNEMPPLVARAHPKNVRAIPAINFTKIVVTQTDKQTLRLHAYKSKTNCQISDMIKPEVDGYGSYQSIYYFTNSLNTSAVSQLNQVEFNCVKFDSNKKNQVIKVKDDPQTRFVEDIICNQDNMMRWGKPPIGTCPVSDEDIEAASSFLHKWPLKRAAFCNLQQSLVAYEKSWEQYEDSGVADIEGAAPPVKIVFIGGSETKADYVQLQCCIKQPSYLKCAQYTPDMAPLLKEDKYYCSWSGYFARWIRARFPHKTFEFFNVAQGGANSFHMAGEVAARFDDFNLTSLTSNDIIFLDHSSNDGHHINSWGFELLVRNIYSHFSLSDPPTIVILEQLPYNRDDKKWYGHLYRLIGQHYNLPVFSFYEAMHSEKAQKKRPPIITQVITNFVLHVPYSVHLLMADMLAGFVENLLVDCNSQANNTEVMKIKTSKPQNSQSNNSSIGFLNSAPAPATLEFISAAANFRTDNMCMPHNDVLLKYNVSYSSLSHIVPLPTTAPQNLSEFESKLMGWTHYTDRHQPGWIINKNAKDNNANFDKSRLLYFLYPIDKLRSLPNSTKVLIRVTYLKTYENAGGFWTIPCAGTVLNASNVKYDSLFVFGDRKVSVPTTKSFVLTVADILLCPNFQPHESSIAKGNADYNNNVKDLKGSYFGFYYADADWQKFAVSSNRHEKRMDYKVKINSVTLCISNDNTPDQNS